MGRLKRKQVEVEPEPETAEVLDLVVRLKAVGATEERTIIDVESDSDATAARWAHTAPMSYVQCRLLRHSWSGGSATVYRLDRSHIGQSLECGRCGMRRVDVYRKGQYGIVYRRYLPPEGYSLDKSTDEAPGSIPRYVVQEALIARSEMVKALPEHLREIYQHYRNHQ